MSHLWERNFKKQHQKNPPKKTNPKSKTTLKDCMYFHIYFCRTTLNRQVPQWTQCNPETKGGIQIYGRKKSKHHFVFLVH